MRIIDDKGRLFGKINAIDFIALLFLLSFIPMFYFGYKIFTRKTVLQEKQKEFFEISLNLNFIKLDENTLKLLAVGDKEIDEKYGGIGEVTSLGKAQPYKIKFDIGSGKTFLKEYPGLNEILAKLRIKAELREDGLYYKDNKIAVNSPIEFKTAKYTLKAIPTNIEEDGSGEDKEIILKEIILNVILKDLDEDTVKLISIGDKQLGQNGKTIAEIIEVGKIDSNTYNINLGSGNFVTVKELNKKEYSVKLRLKAEIDKGGQLVFNNQLVRYDSPFDFKTDKYLAQCVVTSSLLSERWIEAKVRFQGVMPELAKMMSDGETEREPAGKIIARIQTITSNKNTEIQVLSLENNKFVTIPQPFLRDIEAKVNLLCLEKDGVLYFKNTPAKVENMIIFTSGSYSVSGVIIGIEK